MTDASADVAALIELAGYGPRDPLVVGMRRGGAPPVYRVGGRTSAGEPLTAGTVVYIASLSKQITAACAALLVRQGRLDTGSELAQWMPELPAWAGRVRLRHLVWHTSGLPEVHVHGPNVDRTTEAVLHGLAHVNHLDSPPGTEFRYGNANYVCLATVVERAAGRPLPDFAREHVFAPLGMADTRYWSGPGPHPPAAAPLDDRYPAPLSLGDGGVWSTAPDLMRWTEGLDRDDLGVTELLQTPGHLDDGTELTYAWALGVREHAGRRIYRHGGGWPGLSAQLVRLAGTGSAFVILALDDNADRAAALATTLIESLAPPGPG